MEKHFIRIKFFFAIPSPDITWTKLKVGLLKVWCQRQVGKYEGSMRTRYDILFFKFIVVLIAVLMTLYSLFAISSITSN